MAPWMVAVMNAGSTGFFRLLGGRMRVQGRPLLLLTTAGAKTGKRRQTTLGSFPDDPVSPDTWLVVASAGGAATHPAWYMNLARRPDAVSIDIQGRHVAVEPQSLHGPERERAWARIVALAPGYGKYKVQTDREIPIVRLTRKP
jgi:deazaflavin-dependent oxidoreductase (nitroreductase family)